MDGEIRELDPTTVERIAAGEVVERPASVVKELVENSLDADADRVEVAVEAGGKEGIRVADDGVGMTEREVRKAVEKHTTSKIRDVSDLESGVATLGFRGEALHAIGAVSRLTIETRPRGGDRGTKLRVEGGEVTAVEPTGCPEGTTVEVADLFYNVPARRKYLKQDGTEFAHVNRVVTGYALANPDVRVSLSHDGRETFATTGGGDLRSAVMAVYGREVAQGMIDVAPDGAGDADEVDGTSDDGLPDGPLTDVTGLVSHPETTRASAEYVTVYVNGRYVRSSAVRDAVVEAYGNQLAPDRYPFAVLFLTVPGDTVDVNVHPRKTEVRFAEGERVREQVRTAVEDALLREGILRSSAPRGRSAPEQTEIDPGRGDTRADDGNPPGADPDAETGSPADAPDASAPETGGPDSPTRTGSPIGPGDIREDETGVATDAPGADGRTDQRRADPDGTETGSRGGASDVDSKTGADGVEAGGDTADARADAGSDSQGGTTGEGSDGGLDPHSEHRRFRPGTEQARLGGDGLPDEETFDRLPSMRVLGQLDETYVVAEADGGLVLVDQHAADERVNYERLRERFAGETTAQALAEPVELSLTAREAALFEEYEEALARLGFRAGRTGDSEARRTPESASSAERSSADSRATESRDDGDEPRSRTVEVRTVPELVAETAGPELVREVLSAFVTGEAAAAETVDAAADELLADLACYPSITGNTSLTEGSVLDLLHALDGCENPWACPHGRPVVIELDREEIESRFERDYPGHTN